MITNRSAFYKWVAYIALVLVSLALLQPPFEGFDENAHYSRILDASNDINTQFSGRRGFRSDVSNYPGPEAYASGDYPFSTAKTYDRFYLLSPESMARVKQYPISLKDAGVSSRDNWQYQHPPMYYVFSGVFNRVFHFETMVANIIALRMFSVSLVVLALVFCYKGLSLLQEKFWIDGASIETVIGVFALCFPMFYFEFARLGNDALVFLWLSVCFCCSARAYKLNKPQSSLLGMSIGLTCGLWTKATVLPLLPVFAMFALYCLWQSDVGKNPFLIVRDFAWAYVLPVAIGLGWYVFSYWAFNDIGLGSEVRDLGQSSGLFHGLVVNFDLTNFVRGLAVPLVTFVYAGSWSLIRAPLALYVVMSMIYSVFIVRYISYLVKCPRALIAWMPVGVFAFLYAGLAYHVLVSMALSGLGTSGGWYLYVLTPWVLVALCLGFDKKSRFFVKTCQWIGLCVSVGVFTINMLIYSGFVTKDNFKEMRFVGEPWQGGAHEIFQRLSYVSYPKVAALLFLAASILVVINMSKKNA